MSQETFLTSESSRSRKSRWEKVLLSTSQPIERISHAISVLSNSFSQYEDELNPPSDLLRITERMLDCIKTNNPGLISNFISAFNVIIRSASVLPEHITDETRSNYLSCFSFLDNLSSPMNIEQIEASKSLCSSLFLLLQDTISSNQSTPAFLISPMLESLDAPIRLLSRMLSIASSSLDESLIYPASHLLLQMRRDAIDAANSIFGFLRMSDSKKLHPVSNNRRKHYESLLLSQPELSGPFEEVMQLFYLSPDSLCLPGCTELLWRSCRHFDLPSLIASPPLQMLESKLPGILQVVKMTPVPSLECSVRSFVASHVASLQPVPRFHLGTAFVEVSLLRDAADVSPSLSVHPLLHLAARVDVGRLAVQIVGAPLPVDDGHSAAVSIQVEDALKLLAAEGADLTVGGSETLEVPWMGVGRVLFIPGAEPTSRRVSLIMSTAEMQEVVKSWTGQECVGLVEEIATLSAEESETCLFQVVIDGFAGEFAPLSIPFTPQLESGVKPLSGAANWLLSFLREEAMLPQEMLAEEEEGFESVAVREAIANCTPRLRTPSVRTARTPPPGKRQTVHTPKTIYREPSNSRSKSRVSSVQFATVSSILDFEQANPTISLKRNDAVEVEVDRVATGRTPPISDGVALAKWNEQQKRKGETAVNKGSHVSIACTKFLMESADDSDASGKTQNANEEEDNFTMCESQQGVMQEAEFDENEESGGFSRPGTPMPCRVPVSQEDEEETANIAAVANSIVISGSQTEDTESTTHAYPDVTETHVEEKDKTAVCVSPAKMLSGRLLHGASTKPSLFSTPAGQVTFASFSQEGASQHNEQQFAQEETFHAHENKQSSPMKSFQESFLSVEEEPATQILEDIIIDPSPELDAPSQTTQQASIMQVEQTAPGVLVAESQPVSSTVAAVQMAVASHTAANNRKKKDFTQKNASSGAHQVAPETSNQSASSAANAPASAGQSLLKVRTKKWPLSVRSADANIKNQGNTEGNNHLTENNIPLEVDYLSISPKQVPEIPEQVFEGNLFSSPTTDVMNIEDSQQQQQQSNDQNNSALLYDNNNNNNNNNNTNKNTQQHPPIQQQNFNQEKSSIPFGCKSFSTDIRNSSRSTASASPPSSPDGSVVRIQSRRRQRAAKGSEERREPELAQNNTVRQVNSAPSTARGKKNQAAAKDKFDLPLIAPLAPLSKSVENKTRNSLLSPPSKSRQLDAAASPEDNLKDDDELTRLLSQSCDRAIMLAIENEGARSVTDELNATYLPDGHLGQPQQLIGKRRSIESVSPSPTKKRRLSFEAPSIDISGSEEIVLHSMMMLQDDSQNNANFNQQSFAFAAAGEIDSVSDEKSALIMLAKVKAYVLQSRSHAHTAASNGMDFISQKIKNRHAELVNQQKERHDRIVNQLHAAVTSIRMQADTSKKNLVVRTKSFVMQSTTSLEKIESLTWTDLDNLFTRFISVGGGADRQNLKSEVDLTMAKIKEDLDALGNNRGGDIEKAALMKKLEAVLSSVI